MMVAVPRWLPNALSALRIALVPVWVVAAESEVGNGRGRALAVTILVAIGVTDVVDGYVARRFGLTSRLGAVLDAVADKLAQVVLVTWLSLWPNEAFAALPLWFLLLLIVRDAVLLTGLGLVRLRCGHVEVVHKGHGKLTSALLFVVLLAHSAGVGGLVTLPVLLALGALVAWSAGLYVGDGWRQWSAGAALHPHQR